MRKSLAASVLVTAVLTSGYAHAFVEDQTAVAQQSSLTPPASQWLRDASKWRSGSDDSVRFLGKMALPRPRTLRSQRPLVDQVIAYFEQTLGVGNGLELQALETPTDPKNARITYVQTVHGVPVVGTYALAQVENGFLHYARAVLVTPPKVNTKATVGVGAARDAALKDVQTFADSADLAATDPQLVIVYAGLEPRLAWQVEASTQFPYGTWSVFVDAHTGTALLRHKTSLSAVHGTVYGEFEPACQGDKPERVAVPNVSWGLGQYTDSDGAFESSRNVPVANVSFRGRYFSVFGFGGGKKSWNVPLEPDADNEVTLDDAPLAVLDPYIHADRVRTWARSRLDGFHSDAFDKTMAWTERPTPILANVTLMSCNAVYMPLFGGILAFFSGQDGRCNNAGQIAKVVYHEYGHGIHHHLSGGTATFDPQVSEGAGDYVASTLTNNPDMTGLLKCDEVLPTGKDNVVRTCSNHYTYCADASKCDTAGNDEPHNTAPIMCGAWWDTRNEFIKRYGEATGVAKADALFLKFLSVATKMDAAYSAAIAADDDDDGDPSNGTAHSCEINNAFLGATNGLPHFPDSVAEMVPCHNHQL